MDIINSIISLGASVMMPVIFFIIALCFGVKIGTAFKAGMLVGIGFEGVGLVIGLLLTNLGPASQAMVETHRPAPDGGRYRLADRLHYRLGLAANAAGSRGIYCY